MQTDENRKTVAVRGILLAVLGSICPPYNTGSQSRSWRPAHSSVFPALTHPLQFTKGC